VSLVAITARCFVKASYYWPLKDVAKKVLGIATFSF
jgi:hypothetical protein